LRTRKQAKSELLKLGNQARSVLARKGGGIYFVSQQCCGRQVRAATEAAFFSSAWKFKQLLGSAAYAAPRR